MKGRHQVFDIEIYDKKLVVVDSHKAKYVNKLLDSIEFSQKEIYGTAIYDGYKSHKAVWIIVNSEHDNFHPSVIAHEAVHCANMLFAAMGHELDPNNDEPQAYLTEWIFKQAFDFIYDGKS